MRKAAFIVLVVVGFAIVLVVHGWHLLVRPELTEAELMNLAWPWMLAAVSLVLVAFFIGNRA